MLILKIATLMVSTGLVLESLFAFKKKRYKLLGALAVFVGLLVLAYLVDRDLERWVIIPCVQFPFLYFVFWYDWSADRK